MSSCARVMFIAVALVSGTLSSAAPASATPGPVLDAAASIEPSAVPIEPMAVALGKIAGNYSGSVVVTGVHTRPVKVTLKQAANGTLTGTATSTQDTRIKITVTGKVTSATAFTFKLSGGTHGGGVIAGSGTGTIKGKTLAVKVTFVQGTRKIPGTLSLKKI
jgi:hypothetical protein